jgi:hypothetical protein
MVIERGNRWAARTAIGFCGIAIAGIAAWSGLLGEGKELPARFWLGWGGLAVTFLSLVAALGAWRSRHESAILVTKEWIELRPFGRREVIQRGEFASFGIWRTAVGLNVAVFQLDERRDCYLTITASQLGGLDLNSVSDGLQEWLRNTPADPE